MRSRARLNNYVMAIVAFAGCEAVAASAEPADKPPQASIDVGMSNRMIQNIPKENRSGVADPLMKLMKEQTGIQGNIKYLPDAMTLAAELNEGKVLMGVFQGHEFAWAKAKYPKLTPIVVAVPMQPAQAFILVSWDSKATKISDVSKQKVSLTSPLSDFCTLFLDKEKEEHLKGSDFAGRIEAKTATDAIFDVIEGKAGCTIVDNSTLKFFQKVYPGPAQSVRVLGQSPAFPNACVAVKKNGLDETTVNKFRDTLLKAHSLQGTEPLLTSWKLKNFAKVPDDYDQALSAVLKQFPTPLKGIDLDK